MKYFTLILSGMLSLSAFADFAMPKPVEPSKGFKCWKAMGAQFERDGVAGQWRPKMGANMSFIYTAPTARLGRWWILDKEEKHEVLVRETPYDRLVLRYSLKDCQAEVATVKFEGVNLTGFTDASLAETIQKTKTGLLYNWSPGMGFSLDGIKAIRKVAQEKKLALTILLDPTANLKAAQLALKDAGLTDVTLLPNNSMELRFRNTHMHYPNLTMYRDHQMVDVMVPGLMGAEQYANVVKKYLE